MQSNQTSQREFILKNQSLKQNLEKESSCLEFMSERLTAAEKTISVLRQEIENAEIKDIQTLNASLRDNLASNQMALESERLKAFIDIRNYFYF